MARTAKSEFKPKKNTFEKQKAEKGAPCVFFGWDEKKQETKAYHPPVNCDMNCKSCGFNPKEKDRRLQSGVMKQIAVIDRFDDPQTGKPTEKAAIVNQLTFRKEDNWEWRNILN